MSAASTCRVNLAYGEPPPIARTALRAVAFDLVTTAYSIHRTVGGNLAEILDNIAYTIRERVRIKGEIATLTAQARASGTLITFLPLVLATFMYFVTPTYFRPMFGSIIGWILIVIGAFMIFVGNLIIRRVVAIEV
jgi:tight adherence protein B